MKNSKLNYTIVGVFVIAMLAAAVGSAVLLSGRGGSHDIYVVRFDNVSDIKFGTLVRYEGFPVGQVEKIRPVAQADGTLFDLDISVSEGWKIPADSVARIGKSTFLGAKTVDIQRGTATARLSPGGRITGAPPADMFAAMSTVAGEIGDLSKTGLRPLVQRLVKLVGSADRLMAEDLGQFLASLNGLTGELRTQVPRIAGDLRAFTGNLNRTMGAVQGVLSSENVAGLKTVLKNVERVSHEFVQLSINLQGTLDQVNGVVADMDRIVRTNEKTVGATLDDTRYVLRSLARNIDAINHNLAGTTRNMNEFSRLIRQNPGLLLRGTSPEEVKAGAEAKKRPAPALSQRKDP